MRPDRIPRTALAFGAADTTKDLAIVKCCELYDMYIEVPNWTNAVTLTVYLVNADAKEIAISAALARNANYLISVNKLVSNRGEKLRFTLSGAPGGSGGTLQSAVEIINYDLV